MNILFPLGGIGKRFSDAGYRFPKPLINIVGRPMLFLVIDNLKITSDDIIYIAAKEEIFTIYHLIDRLRITYPKYNFRKIVLEYSTWGAAETLTAILSSMTVKERQRRTISLDCDTVYYSDILSACRQINKKEHVSFFFLDHGNKPLFSYLQIKDEEKFNMNNLDGCNPDNLCIEKLPIIIDMKEKEKISPLANTGAYCFANANILLKYCMMLLDASTKALKGGEYYTSHVYTKIINDGGIVRGINVPKFAVLGTPIQLKEFLNNLESNKIYFRHKLRFCFDLDLTLVTPPKVRGDYTTCEPVWSKIHLVRQLKLLDQYIIIQTARRMRTHSGNVGRVIKDIGMITMQQLNDYGIPYDEIVFGKPHAHIYVDDLAVNAYIDTSNELGILKYKFEHEDNINKSVSISEAIVEIIGAKELLKSQSFFYHNIPSSLDYMFPKLINYQENMDDSINKALLCVSVVPGRQFSKLLKNKTITNGRLSLVMKELSKLHKFKSNNVNDSNCRILSQLQQVQHIDSNIMHDIESLLNSISLNNTLVQNIHGNCFLSNIIFNRDEVYFVSMRSSNESMGGSILDDLSQFLSCLYGLELLKEQQDLDHFKDYLQNLRQHFMNEIDSIYGDRINKKQLLAATVAQWLIFKNDKNNNLENVKEIISHMNQC